MNPGRALIVAFVGVVIWIIFGSGFEQISSYQQPVRQESSRDIIQRFRAPAAPATTEPQANSHDKPNPVVLVRASEERIHERMRSTRRQIEDKEMLARRLEDRLDRLLRVDPDVRRDSIEEIRDVRRGALADIDRDLRELPRQIAGWRSELDSVVLAGNAEAIEIDARARSHLDWIGSHGVKVLEELQRRFERMVLP